MRFLALAAVVWSFVGVPTLCRAGVLVECCVLGSDGHERSHDVPEKCPDGCPCETGEEPSGDTETSPPRDCDTCAESCNVLSTHSKSIGGDDFSVRLLSMFTVAQVSCDVVWPQLRLLCTLRTMRPGEHPPIPASERPLLI